MNGRRQEPDLRFRRPKAYLQRTALQSHPEPNPAAKNLKGKAEGKEIPKILNGGRNVLRQNIPERC